MTAPSRTARSAAMDFAGGDKKNKKIQSALTWRFKRKTALLIAEVGSEFLQGMGRKQQHERLSRGWNRAMGWSMRHSWTCWRSGDEVDFSGETE